MSSLREKLGTLTQVNEIAYERGIDTRVGQTCTLKFNLVLSSKHARETLVFVSPRKRDAIVDGIEPMK